MGLNAVTVLLSLYLDTRDGSYPFVVPTIDHVMTNPDDGTLTPAPDRTARSYLTPTLRERKKPTAWES